MQTPEEMFFKDVILYYMQYYINNECLRCESNTDSDKPKNYILNANDGI